MTQLPVYNRFIDDLEVFNSRLFVDRKLRLVFRHLIFPFNLNISVIATENKAEKPADCMLENEPEKNLL